MSTQEDIAGAYTAVYEPGEAFVNVRLYEIVGREGHEGGERPVYKAPGGGEGARVGGVAGQRASIAIARTETHAGARRMTNAVETAAEMMLAIKCLSVRRSPVRKTSSEIVDNLWKCGKLGEGDVENLWKKVLPNKKPGQRL